MTKKIAIIAIFLLIPFVGHAQTVKPTREQLLTEIAQLQAELIALLQASSTPVTRTPLVGTHDIHKDTHEYCETIKDSMNRPMFTCSNGG